MKNKGALTQVLENISVWAALEAEPHVKQEMEQTLAVLEQFIAGVPDDLGNWLKGSVTYTDNNGYGVIIFDDESDAKKIKRG